MFISVLILQCGLREDGDGGVLSDRGGWLWPWHQFPVVLFPVHSAAPSPLLPETTIAAFRPNSQVDTSAKNYVTGTIKTMSPRPCRRTVAQQLSHNVSGRPDTLFTMSQFDPVPLLSIVDQCWKSRNQLFMIILLGLLTVLSYFAIAQEWTKHFYWSTHSFVAKCASATIPCPSNAALRHLLHLLYLLTKKPFLFGTRKDVIEPTIKPRVSPLSVSKGAGVSGATGPHTLLTTSLVAVTSEQGAASLPLTIISLATLPCWCWWRPWTNTAICIQLGECSALWVCVWASPWAESELVGNFNSCVVTLTLKHRCLQRGKNDKIIERDVVVGLQLWQG